VLGIILWGLILGLLEGALAWCIEEGRRRERDRSPV